MIIHGFEELLTSELKQIFAKADFRADRLTEIRLRAGKPLQIGLGLRNVYLKADGGVSKSSAGAYIVGKEHIAEVLNIISGYSIYAFEEEIRNGFITVKGGHRVGICGKAVLENGEIKTMRNISSLNIRISHEIKGCADSALKYILKGGDVCHTLIISPPGCGKTTLLRDIIRQLSDKGFDTAVVDERSEIAGSYMGTPQNDVGARTDILDCCPKEIGMRILLRSMSPKVIAVDEIGKNEDIYAIREIVSAGVKLICTVHGENVADIMRRPALKSLMEENIFEAIITIDKQGVIGFEEVE